MPLAKIPSPKFAGQILTLPQGEGDLDGKTLSKQLVLAMTR